MRYTLVFLFLLSFQFLAQSQIRFDVSSESEFEDAHDQASSGDSIVWQSGIYSDIFMDITRDNIVITAEEFGAVLFNGASKVEIDGDQVTLSGFQFVGGNIGTDHVIRIFGSDVLVTEINIKDYTSYKYLIVDEDSRRTTISFSNFENRLNLDDQNILSILVDNEPGFHKVQYCSFKNFDGTGNDLGIEPIRIGVSTQAHLDSRTIVEYCYFSNCDGDGELISNKAAQNVIRYNTFIDNSKAELVLRHGDDAIVYGNFFINNMGGIRVREGSNHYIFNNYFEGLDKRAIYLQNESSDPLEGIHVYFNTILNSQEVILGGNGSNPPQNVTFANNIFIDPQDDLFEEATGNETWLGNMSFGSLGITRPPGLTDVDPKLIENELGFYQLQDDSPAIDDATEGYPSIPLFEGLDYDAEIILDLMKQNRPSTISSKDIGAAEYSASVLVQPHATESNTGPTYLSGQELLTINTIVQGEGSIVLDPMNDAYAPGSIVTATAVPGAGFSFIMWNGELSGAESSQTFLLLENIEIEAVFESTVLSVEKIEEENKFYPNPANGFIIVDSPKPTDQFIIMDLSGQEVMSGKIKSSRVDVSSLKPGIYLMKISQNGSNFKFIKR